jgi:peptidyl-prolyl cis-trans isomerase A (cyclophilin A)
MRHNLFMAAAMVIAAITARPADAGTIVRFTTNLGTFDVQLFDEQVPTTVANFLGYVGNDSYVNSLFHRSTTYDSADIQIVQGGGFALVTTPTTASLDPIATADPIPLEAGLPNLRGTIAMARTNDPNSATSGWFFNVQDNPALDSGYAVFGEVIGDGISVIDAIGGLTVYNAEAQLGGAFRQLPLLANSLDVQNLALVGNVAAVPEPSTLALGVACVFMYTIRRLRPRHLGGHHFHDDTRAKRTEV